jgi:peptidyl-prolyl cis-trans isomerase B (cyclophilin B)
MQKIAQRAALLIFGALICAFPAAANAADQAPPIGSGASAFMSVLFPIKLWYAPSQPIEFSVKGAGSDVNLVLTDFNGKAIDPSAPATISGDKTIDLKSLFPLLNNTPGTYVLWAVPPGKATSEFVGTPLVIEVRQDTRHEAPPGPLVVHVHPLRYAVLKTELGDMTLAFYFDVAPNTAESFLRLSQGGYYDGLVFHRIVPNFVLQAGDPRGDGTGGPGYSLPAEFNDREHREGVLSMAREGDPLEREGAMPRAEAANSAGSQFFICLNYERTKQLDKRYTVFGKVVQGMDTANALGKVPVGGPSGDTPEHPPVIQSIRVYAVTAAHNPYAQIITLQPSGPTTLPGR